MVSFDRPIFYMAAGVPKITRVLRFISQMVGKTAVSWVWAICMQMNASGPFRKLFAEIETTVGKRIEERVRWHLLSLVQDYDFLEKVRSSSEACRFHRYLSRKRIGIWLQESWEVFHARVGWWPIDSYRAGYHFGPLGKFILNFFGNEISDGRRSHLPSDCVSACRWAILQLFCTILIMLFKPGFDTTSNALAYTAWMLSRHPQVLERCQVTNPGLE